MFKLINKTGNKYNILDTSDEIMESVILADVIYVVLQGYIICGITLNNGYLEIGCDNTSIQYSSSSKQLIVGSRKEMNCGKVATVIEDTGASSIRVQFEDGLIKSSTRRAFNNGNVKHPDCNVREYYKNSISYSIIGQRRKMNCGYFCTVIRDKNADNITVRFDDGSIVDRRHRAHFNNGSILHPSLKDTSIIGLTLKMNCGLVATVVEDKGASNITVKFENGDIIEKRSRRDFKNRNIAAKGLRGTAQVKSRLGERAMMQNGLWAEIIAYVSSRDITVKFDIDDYIVSHRSITDFNRGFIAHPDYTPYALSNILGQRKLMVCGLSATVIKDSRVDNIDVQFSDGKVVSGRHRYEFLNGNICHPDYRPKVRNSLLGISKQMHNGLTATVKRDDGVYDIDVMFNDGYTVYNTSRTLFKTGYIRHPEYTLNSLPELLVYKYIHTSFPDAIHNYRPDWLKNINTGRNLELDIWIPSLKIGIEYDGSTFHSEETALSLLKFNLITDSPYINKVYTLLEPNCVIHSSTKHNNIVLTLRSSNKNYLGLSLQPAIQKLLSNLGISRVVDFNCDSEYLNVRSDINEKN